MQIPLQPPAAPGRIISRLREIVALYPSENAVIVDERVEVSVVP